MSLPISGSSSISIPVTAEVAASFRQMPAERRDLLTRLLGLRLEQAVRGNADELIHLMDRAGREAKEKGLTPEILQSILDED
jgi:hypothetical protein